MKKQLKALALILAILTSTACGSKEAKTTENINLTQEETENEVALANIKTPKANNVVIEEENKEDKKSYLIPQTLELKEEEKAQEIKEAKKETTEEEVVANLEVSTVKEEAVEAEPIKEEKTANYDDAYEVFVGADEEEYEYTEEKIEDDKAVAYLAEEKQEVEAKEEKEEKEEAPLEIKEEAVVSAPAENEVEVTVNEANEIIEEVENEEEKEETPVEIKEEAPVVNETKENNASGLTLASPTIEEIKSYWKNYQTKANDTFEVFGLNLIDQESDEIFSEWTNLDLNNIALGALSQQAQEDALHIANTARFASGIKNKLVIGQNQAQAAQAASLVNRLNDEISHNPEQVSGLDSNIYQLGIQGAANSNLASNYGLLDSVLGYIRDDLGERNQAEVGHRRWVLNPAETEVGFGLTDEYSAMYVNNNEYNGENEDLVYAYPGQTAISEFHSEEASLSLMFGENFDLTNAKVSVTDLQTGEVRNDAHIDQNLKGWVKSITFGKGMNFQPGTKLQVKVTGVTKDGAEYPVEYTIEYASIN